MAGPIGTTEEAEWKRWLRARVRKAAIAKMRQDLQKLREGEPAVVTPAGRVVTREWSETQKAHYLIEAEAGRRTRDEDGEWLNRFIEERAREATEMYMEAAGTMMEIGERIGLPSAGAVLRECEASHVMSE